AHIFVAGDPGAALTYGGNTDCGLANDTWSLDLATDTWSQVTVSPSGMTCPRTGNPDCAAPTARMCD
ncbi:MAG: kelch repeat-containing protein, partial [Myxococcota bacterium]